jgi:hypothetical protein
MLVSGYSWLLVLVPAASWPDERAALQLMIGIPTVIVWVVAGWFWNHDRKIRAEERAARTWLTVRGSVGTNAVDLVHRFVWFSQVTDLLGVLTASGGSGAYWSVYQAKVQYWYAHRDKSYIGDRIHFAPRYFWRHRDAEKALERYQPGSEVAVHYKLEDPYQSVLEISGSPRRSYPWIFLAIILTVILAFIS